MWCFYFARASGSRRSIAIGLSVCLSHHVHNVLIVHNVLNVHPTNHAQVFRARSLASWQPGLTTSCQISRIFPFTPLVPARLRAKSAIYDCLVLVLCSVLCPLDASVELSRVGSVYGASVNKFADCERSLFLAAVPHKQTKLMNRKKIINYNLNFGFPFQLVRLSCYILLLR